MPLLTESTENATPDAVAPEVQGIDLGPTISSQIDSLFADPATPVPDTGTKPDAEKPAAAKPDKVEKKPDAAQKPDAAKAKEEPKAAAKPEEHPKPTEGPVSAKELRKLVETLQKENTELKQSRTQATKPDPNAPDPKALTEQLTTAQKELQRLQDEMRYVNYEQSPEYVQKFKEPMDEAFKGAYSDIAELKANDNGELRQATEKDFLNLLKLPLGDATSLARQMFGDAAPEVMAHRRKIIDLNNARTKAVNEYRENGAKRENAVRQQQAAELQRFQDQFKQISDATVKKYPQFFGPEDGDEKGNQELQKGFEYIDRVYSDKTLTPEQQLLARTQIRLRAAAYPRELHRTATLRAEVAELKKELEAYRNSDPARKPSSGATPADQELSAHEMIDKLARG